MYHKYQDETLVDKELYGTTRTLYDFMLKQVWLNQDSFCATIGYLAAGINRSPATARFHLKKLIKLGYVTREFRFDRQNPKWNIESRFFVHEVRIRRENSEGLVSKNYSTPYEKSIPTPMKNQHPNNRDSSTQIEERESTLARGAELPKEELLPSSKYDLTGVPEIMHSTAEYWLMKTGKTSLSKREVEAFIELAGKHMPVRIQKEIDLAIQRFIRDGKNPARQSFCYIMKALSHQVSYDPDKNASHGNKDTLKAALPSQAEPEAELSMPIAEAEHVIAEYEAEQNMARGGAEFEVPVALTELYGAIMEKENEGGAITEIDYLKLCHPEYDRKELQYMYDRSHPQAKVWVREAMVTDKICAKCASPDQCRNRGCKRRVLSVKTRPDGKKCIHAEEVSFQCKHALQSPEANPVYSKYVAASGLTERQAEHTFDGYEPTTDELTVAKAKAILASKSGRNLILAGKSGTGKTHLATAIAIEAMKNEKPAIFTTLSEMLNVIAQASKDNTEAFQVKMKYRSVPLLVLDDWDKASMTDARLGYLFDVIDYRYNHGLQTIVTTNASDMAGMEFKWYPGKAEPLVSRLLENGDMVTIRQASNYRLTGHFCTPKIENQPAEPKVEPAKPVEPKVEPEYEEYDEPDDYDEPDEYEEYSYAERRSDREKGEERSSDGFHSMSEIFSSMGREAETSEKYTDPTTEEEWAELLDDGGFGEYSEEERNELLFGTAHPEEYLLSSPEESEPSRECDDPDEADLRLYGGMYTD